MSAWLLHRLDEHTTGADRQRTLFSSAVSAPSFVEALARATLPSGHPAVGHPPHTRLQQPPGTQQPSPEPA